MKKHYEKERDTSDYDDLMFEHQSAMTGEDLHSKRHIAAELAYRDHLLRRLSNETTAIAVGSQTDSGAGGDTEALLAWLEQQRDFAATSARAERKPEQENKTVGEHDAYQRVINHINETYSAEEEGY